FVGDKLGEPVSWQTVSLDAPLADWLEAPILYFNGHEFPHFTPDDRAKLRQFVEAGGTLFAEACCSRLPFRQGFHNFIRESFAAFLNKSAGVDVVTELLPLRMDDFRLLDHPIGYMSGHYSFRLSPPERDALRRYLTRGGFLLAEACCGRKAFDTAFREQMVEIF